MNTAENGTLFNADDPRTYPPSGMFVITNYLDQPACFDRKHQTWWTPIFCDEGDIYGREDIKPEDDDPLYWQAIEFQKAEALLLPAL